MDAIHALVTIAVGLTIRLGIPIALTALLILILRRLDERWQAQARQEPLALPLARNTGCWDVKKCSAEQRARCSAYAHPDTPCWQHFRARDGTLRKSCLGCDVFLKAPIPVTS